MNEKKHSVLKECFFSGVFAFSIMLMLYIAKGYAPFGDNSFACMDANIQYLDFFLFLKKYYQEMIVFFIASAKCWGAYSG